MTAASRGTDEGDAACFELREEGMKELAILWEQIAIGN
jgi:hypothetical protein